MQKAKSKKKVSPARKKILQKVISNVLLISQLGFENTKK